MHPEPLQLVHFSLSRSEYLALISESRLNIHPLFVRSIEKARIHGMQKIHDGDLQWQ